jgi:hypothetical protein
VRWALAVAQPVRVRVSGLTLANARPASHRHGRRPVGPPGLMRRGCYWHRDGAQVLQVAAVTAATPGPLPAGGHTFTD